MTIRVRFAPSPTGRLHLGNVRTALYNWLFARQQGGTFVLRIEDTDLTRSQRTYEESLVEDLKWLGLDWNEGVGVGGEYGPYRQGERLEIYRRSAGQLLESDKAYYCFCSTEELEQNRQKQQALGQPPRYSGKCAGLSGEDARKRIRKGEQAVLRLRVRPGQTQFEDLVFGPLQMDCGQCGDFILLRSDGTAPYNFACVIDDSCMKISHVVRGEGHISNTYRQLLIYEALGFEPPHFAHLSTILGPDGNKLSKRHGATAIQEFREQGYLPEALANYLALLGWAPAQQGGEILAPHELASQFTLSRVNRSPATFDREKLNWVNRSHIGGLDPSTLVALTLPYFQARGWIPSQPSDEIRDWLKRVLEAIQGYMTRLGDAIQASEVIFGLDPETWRQEAEVRETLSEEGAPEVIREFARQLKGQRTLDVETYRQVVEQVKMVTGRKGRQLFHPLRIALTARGSGLELDRLIPLLQTSERLALPVEVLSAKRRVELVLEQLP